MGNPIMSLAIQGKRITVQTPHLHTYPLMMKAMLSWTAGLLVISEHASAGAVGTKGM